MNRLLLALMAFSAAAHASVTLTIPAPVSAPPIGAYAQVNLVNCENPTILNSSVAVPPSQSFYFNGQPSVTVTVADNVSQIVCNGNQLSYYTVNYVSFGVVTLIKSVELPAGIFNLANLANVVEPPFNSGVISGPVGPTGPAGPVGVSTDNGTNGGFNVPGTLATTQAQFNIINPNINTQGISTNYTQDFAPDFTGPGYTNSVNSTTVTIDAPSYSNSVGSGPADGWTVWSANAINAYFRSAGISQGQNTTVAKSGIGDIAAHYIYMYLRGGATTPNDEAWADITANTTEDPNPITSTVTTGGTGATTIKLACGSSCNDPGVGQYLVERNTTPATSYITAISSNLAGCGGCQPSTLTTAETVPVSDAWGTFSANIFPPNPQDPTNPASWATTTFTINVLHGAVTQDMWACAGSGRYERFQILTASSLSGGQQTLTAKMIHPQWASGQGPNAFDNGWVMFDNNGLCATTNGIDFVANRIGAMHYVQPVLGATDAHSIRLQSNYQGYTQTFFVGNMVLTASTSTSITRAGNLVRFLPNFDPKGNAAFSHNTLTISGATNASLNGTCTNSYIVDFQTMACTLAGPDITTPDTTGKVTVGTTGYGNTAYERVGMFEIYDVRDTTQPTAYTDYTTTPPTFHASQQLDGTFHIAPNPGRWTTGETVNMYNNYLWAGHAINTNSTVNNPLTSVTNSWEDIASGGAIGPTWNFLKLENDNPFSMYAGHGGVLGGPRGLHFIGPMGSQIISDFAPTLNGNFINVGCGPLGCNDPTYTGYYPRQLSTNGGGVREFLDIFNAIDTVSISGTVGAVNENYSGGAQGAYKTTTVNDGTGNSTLSQTPSALSFNKTINATGLQVAGNPVCQQNGTNCPGSGGGGASGITALVAGVATISTTSACAVSSSCVILLSNCGIQSSTATGFLSTTTVTPGVSFSIQSSTTGLSIQTGDTSNVCWKIN